MRAPQEKSSLLMSGRIIDISRTISSDALVYPGDDPLHMQRVCEIGDDCAFNLTRLGWSTHFLTHVDVPLHFFQDGAALNNIPLQRFVSNALVVEVEGDVILPEHVPSETEVNGHSILFKTRNSATYDPLHYNENHVYVSGAAAQTLVERRANLVGIDYLSIDRFGDESYPAHTILLGHEVLILEGMDLKDVEPGYYQLIALPLKIADGDGSPVRAVLLTIE